MEKPRLLITEDEPQLRDLLSHILKDYYELHFANNGLEAIRFLQENKVDLLILDLVMPIINGIEVLNWIKENGIDVSALLMSSFDIRNIPHPFGKLRIKGFISKPFDIDTLLQHVREAFHSHYFVEIPSEDRRGSERRFLLNRRRGERRSRSYVDPCLIFNGSALRRMGMERRQIERRAVLDRRIFYNSEAI